MQIVQLSGGLGNQLFQYVYYLKLKKMGLEVYLDDTSRYEDGKGRPNQLKLIGASYEPAAKQDILRLTDRDRHLHNWLRRRFTGLRAKVRLEGDEVTEDGYWIGYWQSAKGYRDLEDEINENIFGKRFIDEITESGIKSRIETSLSVSMHIRRGDYLSPEVLDVYGGICTDEYYDSAMAYMREKFEGCTFFIFTNDQKWAKEKYNSPDVIVVEGNDEDHGYRDLYLMSKCKHNIIANSSFSWWGAWLNGNKDKCVVGPSIWIHREGFDKIYDGFEVKQISPKGEILNEY